jgi:hypothetical protein
MEPICLPLGLAALALLGVGAVVMVKLGVLVKYASKEEPPDTGDYHLDQSREPDHQ